MAKKKKGNNKTATSLWVIVVLAIVIYVAQMLAQENKPQHQEKYTELENIIIPEGMTKNFLEDPNLEGSATHYDYTYSGYDRGHMVPAGDMKWNEQAMQECFYMTNIIPQKKALNSGAWNKLEQKIRNWAERDSALIVLTGPIVKPEDLANTIGDINVVVPGNIFKVVLAPYVTPMRAIAFIYPNEKAKGGLDKHVVSVDAVEEATGMDFFSVLPDDVETVIESTSDLNQWNMH